ncbi:MAG: hypothetical protein ACFFAY_15285 [Promethearchaeota archaeon]
MKKKTTSKLLKVSTTILLLAIVIGCGFTPVSARVPGHIEYDPSYYTSCRLLHRIYTGAVVIWGIINIDAFYNGQTGLMHVRNVWFYVSVDSWRAMEIVILFGYPFPSATDGAVKYVKMRCYIDNNLVHSYTVHSSASYVLNVHKEHEFSYTPGAELTNFNARIEVEYKVGEYSYWYWQWFFATGSMSASTGAHVVWDY